jgi:hypothetical protein
VDGTHILLGRFCQHFHRSHLRQRGSYFGVPAFFGGPGKYGYTLSPLTFNVWRRLEQLEIFGK